MSSNFFNIDVIRKNTLIKKNDIYQNSNKKSLEKDIKKLQNNIIESNTKISNTFKDTKYLIHLEDAYEKSLFLLKILKKQTEKNILEKYNIQNLTFLKNNTKNIIDLNNNESIKNVLMKKKFSITSPHLSSIIK